MGRGRSGGCSRFIYNSSVGKPVGVRGGFRSCADAKIYGKVWDSAGAELAFLNWVGGQQAKGVAQYAVY